MLASLEIVIHPWDNLAQQQVFRGGSRIFQKRVAGVGEESLYKILIDGGQIVKRLTHIYNNLPLWFGQIVSPLVLSS